MVLNSQSSRPGTGRQFMSSRRRRRPLWPIALVVVVVLAGGIYLIWPGGDAEQQTAAESVPTENASTAVARAPVAAASSVSPVAAPAPRPAAVAPVTPAPAPVATPTVAPAPVTPPSPAVTVVPPPPAPVAPVALATTTPVADSSVAGDRSSTEIRLAMQQGLQQLEANPIEARRALSEVLLLEGKGLTSGDAQAVREALIRLNQKLVFSSHIHPNDPLAESYTIAQGDLLVRIAPRYKTTYQIIEKINNIDARRIRAGQQIKVLKGPFHARVVKSEFRLDIFGQDAQGKLIYVTSFPVGIGENDSTPVGAFVVGPNKLEDPAWTNPRTGRYYQPSDPENPIGEYWIALVGTDANTSQAKGYGIHGTIDPASIGREMSMGCVRLGNEHIAMVYKLLVSHDSKVEILR